MRLLLDVLDVFHLPDFVDLLLELEHQADQCFVVLLAHSHLDLRFQLKNGLLDAVHFLERLRHVNEIEYSVLPGSEVSLTLLGIRTKFVFYEEGNGSLCLLDDLAVNELLVSVLLIFGASLLGCLDAFLCDLVAVVLHDFEQVLEQDQAPIAYGQLELGRFDQRHLYYLFKQLLALDGLVLVLAVFDGPVQRIKHFEVQSEVPEELTQVLESVLLTEAVLHFFFLGVA